MRVRNDFVSMFLIPTGKHAAILVDAGFDATAQALKSSLAENQLEPADVKAIFLTHLHADHVAALGLFPTSKIYSFASPAEIKELELGPARVTPLKDGQTTDVAGTRVKVYAVPGHTHDGAAFVIRNVLFLGDAATRKPSSNDLKAAPWIFSGENQRADNTKKNVAALKHLHARLKTDGETVHALAMAHSDPITDVDALIRAE